MSFILDALKKSEAERQRQAGPTLLEVRVVPPRRRFPGWSLALGTLLGVNFLLLLWFVLRKPEPANLTPAPQAPAASAVTQPQPPPASTSAPAAVAGDDTVPDNASAQNPADLEPALPASAGHVQVERDTQNLPTFNEVGGNMPALRLDLHVYSQRPSDRYALINMHKVREGDVLPEGASVVEINKDGVVLSYRGQEFILGQE